MHAISSSKRIGSCSNCNGVEDLAALLCCSAVSCSQGRGVPSEAAAAVAAEGSLSVHETALMLSPADKDQLTIQVLLKRHTSGGSGLF